jgi:hypothetical protein
MEPVTLSLVGIFGGATLCVGLLLVFALLKPRR